MVYISIIVPCYNAAKYLPVLIESVQKQTINDWELMLIDDGSEDDTHEVVCKYMNDGRITYISQENTGVSKARNHGLQEASGIYVTFVDADDWLEPDFIEVFQKSNIADINICGYREIYSNGKVRAEWEPKMLYSSTPLDTYTVRNSYFRTPWAVIFRHDFLKGHKLCFLENLSWGEDTMFLLLATMKAKNINFIPNTIYNYRYSQSGLAYSNKRHKNMILFLKNYISYRYEVKRNSIVAYNMMNELILFLAIILLKEIIKSDYKKKEKIEYINTIHQILRVLPFFYILKTKVGRIRYIAALLSRLLLPIFAVQIYKRFS